MMWYLARGAGVVALIALTASVVLGITASTRWRSKRWPRFAVESVHRDVALIATVVLVIHIAAVVLDSYVNVSLKDVVVPFGSSYKPFFIGLGALSVDLTLAVLVSSGVRKHIGRRVWKLVHWLAYGSWPLA